MAQAADHEVYPVHTLDQQAFLRFMLSWVMNFDCILGPNKLKTSLEDLLDIGDWRKLAARLRTKKGSQLEAYVPSSFTQDEPAILFHHTDHADISVGHHPLRKFYIKPRAEPFTQHVDDHRDDLLPPHFPRTGKDLIDRDLPQISLHVVSFNDATLVILTWPHCMMDAPGHLALLQNWSRVLAGRPSDVQPLLGAKEDVLEHLSKDCHEDSLLVKKKMGWASLLLFLLRLLWRNLTRPKLEWRSIFLPEDVQNQILFEARRTVLAQHDDKAFVSDGDIMLAWFTKLVALSEPQQIPMIAMNAVNPRYRLPELKRSRSRAEQDNNGVYMQSMTLPIFNTFSIEQARAPLGEMAFQARQQSKEYTTEQQVLAYLKYSISLIKRGKNAFFFCGDSQGLRFVFNYLATLELAKVSFEPAVLQPATGSSPNADATYPGGFMLNTYNLKSDKADDKLPIINALGKDHAGNFWYTGILYPQAWAQVETELDRLRQAMGQSGC